MRRRKGNIWYLKNIMSLCSALMRSCLSYNDMDFCNKMGRLNCKVLIIFKRDAVYIDFLSWIARYPFIALRSWILSIFFEKRQCLCRKTYRSFEIHLRNKKISKGFLFRKCCKRRKTCLSRDTFSNITRIIIDWKYQPKVFLFSAGKPGIVEFL